MTSIQFRKNCICTFEQVDLSEANKYLKKWNHKMGVLKRGNQSAICHILFNEGRPVGVTTASHLIRANVGGGLKMLTRENTVELSRLCASKKNICRVALRMWREFVYPSLGFDFAVSYQDAILHNGNTYKFDGWKKLGFSHSGTDKRTGRKGRDKWIWVWNRNHNKLEQLESLWNRNSA